MPLSRCKFYRPWLSIICFIIGVREVLNPGLPGEYYPTEYFIDIQPVLQPDRITCGPTSTSMVLSAYQKQIPLPTVICHTHTVWFAYQKERMGMTIPQRIVATLKEYGIQSSMTQGNIHFLKAKIGQDKPCIVLLRAGEFRWHYVVVIGYDQEYIYYADPGDEQIQMLDTKAFMKCWNWETDTSGEECFSYPITILKLLDICPRTIIFPINGIYHE